MKKLKPFLKIAGWLVLVVVLYLAGVIIYGTITDYRRDPGSVELSEIKGKAGDSKQIDSVITLLSWNIGYGGLGKEMDFFYDGGKTVRAPQEIWDKDFAGVQKIMSDNNEVDFYLIQEIDRDSRRSYEVDMVRELNHILQGYASSFAVNYDVNFVPVPYTNPMGKVLGGVATFSRYQPTVSERVQYPGKFPWPTRIFFLDRCYLTQRYPLANGKELIIINTHNSAYDETGEIKGGEMNALKAYVEAEYNKGNYVIAGGDWNQCPPNFQYDKFIPKSGYDGFMPPSMSFDYTPENWIWAYDPDVPTNRHLETPLDENTFRTVIDFFLISPNIKLLKINTIDTKFEYSDHQPVKMQVELM